MEIPIRNIFLMKKNFSKLINEKKTENLPVCKLKILN